MLCIRAIFSHQLVRNRYRSGPDNDGPSSRGSRSGRHPRPLSTTFQGCSTSPQTRDPERQARTARCGAVAACLARDHITVCRVHLPWTRWKGFDARSDQRSTSNSTSRRCVGDEIVAYWSAVGDRGARSKPGRDAPGRSAVVSSGFRDPHRQSVPSPPETEGAKVLLHGSEPAGFTICPRVETATSSNPPAHAGP